MNRTLVFWAFILLFTFPVLQTRAQNNLFNLPEGREKLTTSFFNYDNIIVIEMLLQDSIPIRLILDSGIEGIILTDKALVEYFEPSCIRKFKLSAPGSDNTLDACITPLIKFSYRALEPIYTNVILLQNDFFSLDSFIGAKVHGLIGMDKFRNMVVTINYDKNNIRFTRPELYKVPSKAEVIPLSILRGRPYMTARIELDTKEIRDLWLMIDSGANHPLLLETDSTDTYKPVKSLETTIGRGLGGYINGSFVRSGWLLIGSSRLDNLITSVSSEYLSGNPALRNFRDGTLGSNALARFIVSFDYTNSRMILREGIKFDSPFEYNMSGISLESVSTDFNIFKISEVINDSPASIAGVQPEDLLISINGKSALTLPLGELNGMLSQKPGATITLVVSREGKSMIFKFKLKRLI